MRVYSQGRQDALIGLGLLKTAGPVRPFVPIFKRLSTWVKQKLPSAATFKTGLRRGLIGSPKRFRDELVSGNALGRGSLIRESMHAPGVVSKALFYGLPAVEAGSIAFDDQGDKARRIGGSLGGAALGLAAWRPLGIVGSMGAGMLGERLVGGIAGRAADKIQGPKPAPEIPEVNNPWGYQ